MIRVLIAEDSSTLRELLASILSSDPQIEVIGVAKDGVDAVECTKELRPDIVTMDIHMPRMNGFEATKQIMVETPTPIVIVSSTANVREVAVSMQALGVGALTLLPKPMGPGDVAFEERARDFIQTVKAMAQVKVVRRRRETMDVPPVALLSPASAPRQAPPRVVAIAASTGGPAALHRVLADLPGDFPAPVLVVQHISDGFVGGLATWLNSNCALQVKVAEQGEPLLARTVYLAPDERHLGVSKDKMIRLTNDPPVGGFRPSATSLFESVASVYGAGALSVILTGMGSDGVPGLIAAQRAGGLVIAQDEESCVVFGMPGSAISAGVVGATLPLDRIGARLVEATRPDRRAP